MRILIAALMFVSAFILTDISNASEFSQRSCEQYQGNTEYRKALDTLTTKMNYSSRAELCSLDHLFDVHITDAIIHNFTKNRDEPHVWVTFHYAEHSCQYFVKIEDQSVTKKNCYNTF